MRLQYWWCVWFVLQLVTSTAWELMTWWRRDHVSEWQGTNTALIDKNKCTKKKQIQITKMSSCMCDYLLKWHQELFGMSQKRHIDRLLAWTEIQTMNIRTRRQFFLVLIKRSGVFTSSWHFPWRFPLSACRMMRCGSWLEVAGGVSTTTTLIDLCPGQTLRLIGTRETLILQLCRWIYDIHAYIWPYYTLIGIKLSLA